MDGEDLAPRVWGLHVIEVRVGHEGVVGLGLPLRVEGVGAAAYSTVMPLRREIFARPKGPLVRCGGRGGFMMLSPLRGSRYRSRGLDISATL